MKHYPIHSKVDRAITFGDRELLYFSGTSYLGMGNLPEFEEQIIKGIRKYGASHGSSRGSNLQLQVYEDFENFFSEQAGADRGLLFSSGFMAGSAAVKVLKATSDLIIAAPDAHPAIFPNDQTSQSKMSFEEWIQYCQSLAHVYNGKRITFLSNAVDPLKLQIHSFDWLNNLPTDNTYTLLIDDSHAFGLLGKGLFGTYAKWSQLPIRIITCGSLGKALGIPGGVVLGDKEFIGQLEHETMFRSASPPAPAFYDAFLNSQPLYDQQKSKLAANVQLFKNLTQQIGYLNSCEDYPVFAFEDDTLVEKLVQAGIIVSSFPYPELTDPSVNRIVLSAYHRDSDLHKLALSLQKWSPSTP